MTLSLPAYNAWLLYLSLTYVEGFIKPYDDGCHWKYDLVDSQTLLHEANLDPLKPFTNVTQYLNESITVDFLNNRHTNMLESFEAFPYFLRINIRCLNREDESEIINMGLSNSHPRVVLRQKVYDPKSLCVVRKLMMDLEGVLVQITDPTQLQGKTVTDPAKLLGTDVDDADRWSLKDGYASAYPYAAWLVPLPISTDMHYIRVNIESPRIGKQRRLEQFMLFFDYFKTSIYPAPIAHFNLTPLAATAPIAVGSPGAGPQAIFNTANAYPSALIYSYPSGTSDTVLYTPDEGVSFYRYQFAKQPGSSPCGGGTVETTFAVKTHAVLPYQFLLGTTHGLVQIMNLNGSMTYPNFPAQSVISNQCVNVIITPTVNNVNGNYLSLITDTQVLQSAYFLPDGIFMFNTSFTITDACTAIQKLGRTGVPTSGTCNFKSAYEVGATYAVYAVRIGTDDTPAQPYCLVDYASTRTPQWNVRSCLPLRLPSVDTNMPYTLVNPSTASADTSNFPSSIAGMKHRDVGSQEYYAFGTGLFYSNDGGYGWTYFHQFGLQGLDPTTENRKITKFDYSGVGTRYVALTVSRVKTGVDLPFNEIWVGQWGQPMLYNLYPSYEWELSQLLLPDKPKQYTDWSAAGAVADSRFELGVFFDSLGNLKQTFALKSSTNSWSFQALKFPVDELIPAIYSAKLDVFTDVTTAALKTGANECPSMTVRMTNRAVVERIEYFRFLKPQTRQQDYYQLPEVATVYSVILRSLTNFIGKDFTTNYTSTHQGYSEQVTEYFSKSPYPTKWQYEKIVSRSDPRRIMILQEDYQDLIPDDRNVILADFPDHIYIDRFENFTITVSLYDVYTAGMFGKDDVTGLPKIGFHLANGSLLQGSVVTTYSPEDHIVNYAITFTEAGNLPQGIPGGPLLSDVLSIMIPQSIDCYPNKPVYETTLHVGCRPSLKLQFDWEPNMLDRDFFDCNDQQPNMPCVNYQANPNVTLRLVDYSTNMGTVYAGQFRLYVIGFSMGSPANITRFLEDQVPLYNGLIGDGSNRHQLIWSPGEDQTNTSQSDADYRIRDAKHMTINFVCQKDSPCGNNQIGLFDEPHSNYLIRVTNKDLPGDSTYCLFDLEFVIRVRGAAPVGITVLIPTLFGTLAALIALSACYVRVIFWRVRNAQAYKLHRRKQRELADGLGGHDSFGDMKTSYAHHPHSLAPRLHSMAARPRSVS